MFNVLPLTQQQRKHHTKSRSGRHSLERQAPLPLPASTTLPYLANEMSDEDSPGSDACPSPMSVDTDFLDDIVDSYHLATPLTDMYGWESVWCEKLAMEQSTDSQGDMVLPSVRLDRA